MANKKLFSSPGGKKTATVVNHAGGKAYNPGAEHGLAQMALTCTLADSYYTSSDTQLKEVLELADKCDPEYVAKLAVYAREVGQMKDLPALLVAYLASKYEHNLLDKVFHRVIDNGRMVRNFVQIIRSGKLGRRGLGSQPKRLLRGWFARQGADGVFRNSTGNSPSMADVIKLARPVPLNEAEKEMYYYLIGKGPPSGLAWQLRAWSQGSGEMPRLPFEFLAGAAKTPSHWEDMARGLSWNATLKNLNTFARHEISREAWSVVEHRLLEKPPRHVFPYGVMTAFRYIEETPGIPMSVKVAVQRALDNSLANTPKLKGTVAVCVDTSGSMGSAVTGNRGSATGATTCVEVAALTASAILRKNPETTIVLFDTQAFVATLNPLDSVATNARKLARQGGGTDISCALSLLFHRGCTPDTTIIISDNESWLGGRFGYRGTGAQNEWDRLAGRNKNAKLICLDIQANPTVQVQNSNRVLNLGGFSDTVFNHMSEFSSGELHPESWVNKIKQTEI